MKYLLTTLTTIIAVGMFMTASSVLAQTPDGETPSNEGVCDDLQSATKGLYGLCVAYCEAQDFDEYGNVKEASEKILRNYERKKSDSDPAMPCLRDPCPCFDTADLQNTFDAALEVNCFIEEFSSSITSPPLYGLNGKTTPDLSIGKCQFLGLDESGMRISVGASSSGGEFPVSAFQTCQAVAADYCTSIGQ